MSRSVDEILTKLQSETVGITSANHKGYLKNNQIVVDLTKEYDKAKQDIDHLIGVSSKSFVQRLFMWIKRKTIIGIEVDLTPMYPKTAKTNLIKGRRLDVWGKVKMYYSDGTIEEHATQSWVKFDKEADAS